MTLLIFSGAAKQNKRHVYNQLAKPEKSLEKTGRILRTTYNKKNKYICPDLTGRADSATPAPAAVEKKKPRDLLYI
jgi:hypothetical protein